MALGASGRALRYSTSSSHPISIRAHAACLDHLLPLAHLRVDEGGEFVGHLYGRLGTLRDEALLEARVGEDLRAFGRKAVDRGLWGARGRKESAPAAHLVAGQARLGKSGEFGCAGEPLSAGHAER